MARRLFHPSKRNVDSQTKEERKPRLSKFLLASVLFAGCVPSPAVNYPLPKGINEEIYNRQTECGATRVCSFQSATYGSPFTGTHSAGGMSCCTVKPSVENQFYCRTGILGDMATREGTTPQLRNKIIDVLVRIGINDKLDVVRRGAGRALIDILVRHGINEPELGKKILPVLERMLDDKSLYVRSGICSGISRTEFESGPAAPVENKEIVALFPQQMMGLINKMLSSEDASIRRWGDYSLSDFIVKGEAELEYAVNAMHLLVQKLPEGIWSNRYFMLTSVIEERTETEIRKIALDAIEAQMSMRKEDDLDRYDRDDIIDFLGELVADPKTEDRMAGEIVTFFGRIFHTSGEQYHITDALGKALKRESIALQSARMIIGIVEARGPTDSIVYPDEIEGFVMDITTDDRFDSYIKERAVKALAKARKVNCLYKIAVHEKTEAMIKGIVVREFWQMLELNDKQSNKISSYVIFSHLSRIADDQRTDAETRRGIVQVFEDAYTEGDKSVRLHAILNISHLARDVSIDPYLRKRIRDTIKKASKDENWDVAQQAKFILQHMR